MTAPRPDAPADAQRSAGAVDTLAPPDPAPVPLDLAVPTARSATARALVAAIAGAVLVSYAAVAALVSLLSTTANADWALATTLRSAAPLWLAVHQVPLTITLDGGTPAPLGVLPLLPTLGLAVLVARAAAGVAARLDWHTPTQLAGLAAAFAGTHAALGAAVALAEPTDRMTAAPVPAALGCAAVAGLAALWGGLRAAGFSQVARTLLPPWAVRGVLAGMTGLVGLLAAGAVCTFGGLVLSIDTVRELLGDWGGAPGGQLGVTLLSVAYLPNAVVGALSWATGPGLSVGAVSVTLFGTSSGALPAVPLLAALPESGPAPWRALVFVLPLLAGLLVGRRCRRLGGLDRTDRLHAVVTAAVVAAGGSFALTVLAGGRLGGGAFDPVRIPSASLAIAVFVWIAVPAGLVVGLADRPAWRFRGSAGDVDGDLDDDSGLDDGLDVDLDDVAVDGDGDSGDAGLEAVLGGDDDREPAAASEHGRRAAGGSSHHPA